MDQFCYLCFVFVMLSCLFIAALWPHAGKGLTFTCGILGQVWYSIVLIPDLCHLSVLCD